jgi:hypothetical protein
MSAFVKYITSAVQAGSSLVRLAGKRLHEGTSGLPCLVVMPLGTMFPTAPPVEAVGFWSTTALCALLVGGTMSWVSAKDLAAQRAARSAPGAQNQMAEVVTHLNAIAREMTATLEGTDSAQSLEPQHVVLDVGPGGELINIQDGSITKIITASALELLAADQREQIGTCAISLAHTHTAWRKLYARRKRTPFRFMQRLLDARLRKLATTTREQLDQVLSLLQVLGIKPDDHYMRLRALVQLARMSSSGKYQTS